MMSNILFDLNWFLDLCKKTALYLLLNTLRLLISIIHWARLDHSVRNGDIAMPFLSKCCWPAWNSHRSSEAAILNQFPFFSQEGKSTKSSNCRLILCFRQSTQSACIALQLWQEPALKPTAPTTTLLIFYESDSHQRNTIAMLMRTCCRLSTSYDSAVTVAYRSTLRSRHSTDEDVCVLASLHVQQASTHPDSGLLGQRTTNSITLTLTLDTD